MKRNIFLLVSILGLAVSSCNISQKTLEKSIIIGSYTRPCTAGVSEKDCMQVNWTKEQPEWEYFYGQIEGFTFEEGYQYELIVSEEHLENPPSDAPSIQYNLIEQVSKTKVAAVDEVYSGDNSKNSLDWDGTYEGILPCADCDGIKTIVTLYSDATFNRTQEYMGKSGKLFSDSGTFTWNKEGSTISMVSGNDKQEYKVGENLLFHLDPSGNQIKGELSENYILLKTTKETIAEDLGFEDKKWLLSSIMGKEIQGNEAQYYIIFHSKEKMLNTKVGCNTMNARYVVSDELKMEIEPIMTTMMACPENSIEEEYKNILATVDNITTNGELLHLNRARMTLATCKLIN